MVSKKSDLEFKLLKILEENPYLVQREISEELGLSLGKTNYLIRALVDRGLVKLDNFRKSNNKIGYVYVLTPTWFSQKSRLTKNFLERKEDEYNKLKIEIHNLKKELNQ